MHKFFDLIKPTIKLFAKFQDDKNKVWKQWERRITMAMFKVTMKSLHDRIRGALQRNLDQFKARNRSEMPYRTEEEEEAINDLGALKSDSFAFFRN
jgi:uncharacterized protein YPO0396